MPRQFLITQQCETRTAQTVPQSLKLVTDTCARISGQSCDIHFHTDRFIPFLANDDSTSYMPVQGGCPVIFTFDYFTFSGFKRSVYIEMPHAIELPFQLK